MPDSLSVEIHHDFAVLEGRLADLLGEVRREGGPLAPVAIIVPTRRLIAHLQVTLAERASACHGIRFLHHDGLARAIAGAAGVTLPRLLGDAAGEAILADLARRAGGDLAAFVRDRPGSAAALRTTMEELREARIDPVAARAAGGPEGRLSEGARSILKIYAGYVEALGRLGAAGYSDRAGRAALVLPHAAAFAARHAAVIHYGAYDLTGTSLDLVRALASGGGPVRCLAPGHPTAPAFAYARDFWRDFAGVEPVPIRRPPAGDPRPLADRLPLLHDEDARPGPAAGSFACAHAQGAAAELEEVARRLLGAWRRGDGPPPSRIAVIARTLGPYALHLGPVLGGHGIPFQTSAALPVSRQPAVRAATALLRCLTADFPAPTLCDLLGSGRLRDPGDGAAPGADAAERLLRDAQVHGGRALIVDHLPARVESERPFIRDDAGEAEREQAARARAARMRDARRLADLVRGLAREAAPLAAARRYGAWAAACGDLLGRRVAGFAPGDPDEPGVEPVRQALDDLGALDAAGLAPAPGAAAAAFGRAIEAATLPIGSIGPDGAPVDGDGGGVRVLDAMQARGLAFDVVFLIGMNADLFPRRAREDPFLPDDDRRLLRRSLGRPLPAASEGRDEEHLLLAHLLGSYRAGLVVTWQRADDAGKARTPSLALREIARLALGAPDLEALRAAAGRVSADPAARLLAAVRDDGLIAPGDARLAAAFACRSPGRLRAALLEARPGSPLALEDGDRGAIPAGLGCLEAIDGAAAAGFDALVGPQGDEPAAWSPSRLETLGSCPQQFFFRHVLHVDEWEPPGEPHESDQREMGSLVHEVLRDLYAALHPAAGGPAAGAAPGEARGRALLEAAWSRRSAPVAARMRALYPGLWDLLGAQWIAAIEEFVRRDAATVAGAPEPPRLEHDAEATIALGPGDDGLRLRGRFDRLLRLGDQVVVSDYKTSGRPSAHVEAAAILKGQRLQMPLYILLAERAPDGGRPGAVRAEVLGVGPAFMGARSEENAAVLEPERFAAWRDGFLETLAVLRDLARAGLYPLDAGSARCARCPYAAACRRNHPATLDRLAADPALARFRAIRAKSSRAPTLAAIETRAGRGGA